MTPPDPTLCAGAASYCFALEYAGWEQIGAGAVGRVFHRTGDPNAIKVSDGDDCYLAFVDHVKANACDYLPKLDIVHRTSHWAVVHIEWLEPLTDANAAAVNQWWERMVTYWQSGGPPPEPQEWSDLAAALKEIAVANKCGFDLKSVNFMQRGDTVVFTDPLY